MFPLPPAEPRLLTGWLQQLNLTVPHQAIGKLAPVSCSLSPSFVLPFYVTVPSPLRLPPMAPASSLSLQWLSQLEDFVHGKTKAQRRKVTQQMGGVSLEHSSMASPVLSVCLSH